MAWAQPCEPHHSHSAEGTRTAGEELCGGVEVFFHRMRTLTFVTTFVTSALVLTDLVRTDLFLGNAMVLHSSLVMNKLIEDPMDVAQEFNRFCLPLPNTIRNLKQTAIFQVLLGVPCLIQDPGTEVKNDL
ncbi:hypothetical protein J6590_078453 [Homalodisca vitripennis]|nr:hypothetical protein J6590_078453 [Homalodisca vitripennis]